MSDSDPVSDSVPFWRRAGVLITAGTALAVAAIGGLVVRSEMGMRAPSKVEGTIAVECDDIEVARTCVRLVQDGAGRVTAMGEVESRTWHTEGGYRSYYRAYEEKWMLQGELAISQATGRTSYRNESTDDALLTTEAGVVSEPGICAPADTPVMATMSGAVWEGAGWKQMFATTAVRVERGCDEATGMPQAPAPNAAPARTGVLAAGIA